MNFPQWHHQLRSRLAAKHQSTELAHNSTLAAISFGYDLLFVGLTNILLSHILGANDLGAYASTQALVVLIYGLANLGVQVTSNRQISRSPELANIYLGNSIAIRLTISFPVTVLLALGIGTLFHIGSPKLLILWSIYISTVGIYGLILGAMQALDNFTLSTSISLVSRTFWAAVLVTVAALARDLEILLFCLCLVQVFTLLLATVALTRMGKSPKLRWDMTLWCQIIRHSVPVALAGSAEVVNLRADNVFVASISGSGSAGIYSAAYNLYYFAMVPGYAATLGVFPTLSRTSRCAQSQFTGLLKRIGAFTGLVGLFCALALAFQAESFVAMLYSYEFHAAVTPVQILALAIPFVVLNRLMVQALNASDRQHWTFRATGTGALFNVIGNLLLVPYYGYVGASVTTVFTEALVLAITLIGIGSFALHRN